MNERRIDAAFAYDPIQDKIYVMGGEGLDSCEYYDINNN